MWLRNVIESEKFIRLSCKFIELRKKLLNEHDVAARRVLLEQEQRLNNEMDMGTYAAQG
jgi:adenylosuccinate synthase